MIDRDEAGSGTATCSQCEKKISPQDAHLVEVTGPLLMRFVYCEDCFAQRTT